MCVMWLCRSYPEKVSEEYPESHDEMEHTSRQHRLPSEQSQHEPQDGHTHGDAEVDALAGAEQGEHCRAVLVQTGEYRGYLPCIHLVLDVESVLEFSRISFGLEIMSVGEVFQTFL